MFDPFLLSTAGARGDAIQARMRSEFERARETGAPLGCLAIEIDRFAKIDSEEARAGILRAIDDLVRQYPGADLSLGWRSGEILLLCVPALPLKEAHAFARGLVERARKLRVAHADHVHRATLSVGVAHSVRKGAMSFRTLLAVAEEGVRVAREAGGDRWVHSEQYESFQKRFEQTAGDGKHEELVPVETRRVLQEVWLPRADVPGGPSSAPAGSAAPKASIAPGEAFVERVREMVTHLGPGSPPGALLEKELTAMTAEATAGPSASSTEIFERRIAKLLHALELAEQEIARLSRQHGIQAGIPSIYRTVQGLSSDDALAELKRRLMTRIFEANLALREKSMAQG